MLIVVVIFISVACCFLLCAEMGVQAPPAIPENTRVPVAGGPYCVGHPQGSNGRGELLFSTVHKESGHSSLGMLSDSG